MGNKSLEKDMDQLEISEKQMEILEFLNKEVQEKGYPPSVREMCRAMGFKSTSTIHAQLEKLKDMGYISKDPFKPRAIKIIGFPENKITNNSPGYFSHKELINVPIIGKITAGQPILAVENIEDTFPIPLEFAQNGDVFMLTVQGESMIGAGILDGDMVLVRQQDTAENGDIIVALIDDEATVKSFYHEKDHIRLQPENPYMEPIIVKDGISVLGKVVGVFRKL
jgi:repressor LexA